MSQLLRRVARQIRYVEIPGLIGASIAIRTVDSVRDDIHNGIARIVPEEFLPLAGPPQVNIGALAKYGILDIEYAINDTLVTEGRRGLRLLEELSFLVRGEQGDEFFEQFQDDVTQGNAYLKVFCDTRRPGEPRITRTPNLSVPKGYLPREAQIIDACASNWDFVWFFKHLYF